MVTAKKFYHFFGAGPYIPGSESNLHHFLKGDAHIIFTETNLHLDPVTSQV